MNRRILPMTLPGYSPNNQRISIGLIARTALGVLSITAVLIGLLFIPAGRLDWIEAWVLIASYGIFLLLYGVWGFMRDPAQIEERRKPGANVKVWDKVIMTLYSGLLVVLFPVCALDAGRFRWTLMPAAGEAAGWILLACASGVIFWVMTTNTFASSAARIQSDRSQTVVAAGPYRYVRHPMYLGIILLFIGIPLALGSFWGLVPGGMIVCLFCLRTGLEDRMLFRELPGYPEYTARVRSRLLPGIW
jgi:protein-S-isoprenylcysteine O-methyltransferase Ste14